MKGKKQALYIGEGCMEWELFQGEGTSINPLQWEWVWPTCRVTEDGKLGEGAEGTRGEVL